MNTLAKLTVTETKNKAGKYHYKVIEIATGNVLSERKSNRKYVAATYTGTNYFGNTGLAMKFRSKWGRDDIAYTES